MTREEEKQASRDQDQADLESGAKTAEEIQEKNGFIKARWGLKIDLEKAPVAG